MYFIYQPYWSYGQNLYSCVQQSISTHNKRAVVTSTEKVINIYLGSTSSKWSRRSYSQDSTIWFPCFERNKTFMWCETYSTSVESLFSPLSIIKRRKGHTYTLIHTMHPPIHLYTDTKICDLSLTDIFISEKTRILNIGQRFWTSLRKTSLHWSALCHLSSIIGCACRRYKLTSIISGRGDQTIYGGGTC